MRVGDVASYRLRCVRVGVQATLPTLGLLALYPWLPGNRVGTRPAFLAVLALGLLGVGLVAVLPWDRLFRTAAGLRLLTAWSVLDILLISAALALTGGATSELFVLYALTTVFFAASYPVSHQIALLGFTYGCYATVAQVAPGGITPAGMAMRAGLVGVVAFMANFLSRQLMDQMAAHQQAQAEAEHRAALLATVAAASRAMSTVDTDRLLGTVVDSAVALGFEGAELCMFDEAAGTWTRLVTRGAQLPGYDPVQPAELGLAGRVREQRATLVVDDYGRWCGALAEVQAAGFRGTAGCPVWCGDELVGTLIAGTTGDRRLRPHEVEALELLAAQAGAALLLARRYDERHAHQLELHHRATHDHLTGLPNRGVLFDRVEEMGERAGRAMPVALLFVDLDRFKTVNDSLGHEAGDLLLVQVADRLRGCVRPGDTLARYGGDEFCVVVRSERRGAERMARRIVEAMRQPFALAGRQVVVTASVGLAIVAPGDDLDLLPAADLAMFRAKELGGNRMEQFSPDMGAAALVRLDRESELRDALEHRQFRLHFQPVIDMACGRVRSVEALIRWHHPRLGSVSPAEFIPLAEATGLIVPIGRWAVQEACRHIRLWRDEGLDLTVAVNLSPAQLRDAHVVPMVAAALRAAGVPAERLVLEVTESVLLEESDAARDALAGLDRLGVRFALDDFGSGYASLSYLKRLPLRTVKIDRSFVAGLSSRADDQAIVRAVVSMARDLGITVTAEGVEDERQLVAVEELGCHAAQGFLFSPPVPAGELPELAGTRFVGRRRISAGEEPAPPPSELAPAGAG